MKQGLLLFCVFFLASCAGPTAMPALPGSLSEHTQARAGLPSVKFAHIFSFKGSNGKEPAAALIDVSGTLYGTTYAGGAHDEGTAFQLAANGSQTVLHSFTGGKDGALPIAPLANVGGAFYGTTANGGGPSGEGVVFKISSSGTESVLHHFGLPGDGANPYAGVLDVHGTLFGTTAGGGTNSEGTVFTISSSGTESVLYSFNPGKGDGATPLAGLIDSAGALYGTTAYGGRNCGTVGCGTVYKIDSGGTETVLYKFKGGTGDGDTPSSAVVDMNGTFYGTTAYGGKYNQGTVFKVTSSGTERVLHSFQSGSDGAVPNGLVARNGTLYGTTSRGGSSNDGTIFSVTTAGKEVVLYTFKGGADGATPHAGLVSAGGTLYGTTAKAGTVFSVTP